MSFDFYRTILISDQESNILAKSLKIDKVKTVLYGVERSGRDLSYLLSDDSLIIQAIQKVPVADRSFIVPDLCLCTYTKEGECGIINRSGVRDQEKSISLLVQIAELYYSLGISEIMESAMLPGLVSSLKEKLPNLKIISQAVKLDTTLYNSFRRRLSPKLNLKRKILTPLYKSTYQLGVENKREALLASLQAEKEGADKIVVKPAILTLDLLAQIRGSSQLPLGGFITSGEAQILNFEQILELKDALLRAGANFIIAHTDEMRLLKGL
jgi:porphobilinogen synthase